MAEYQLEIDNASTYYDPDTRIVYITYKGILDADTNVAVYSWLDEIYDAEGLTSIYGQIFDFRKVVEFAPDNLKTARRSSSKMNMAHDTSQIPVGMIVNDFEQGESLRASMRISPKNLRKRFVLSEAEAIAFFDEWYKEHQIQDS